MSSPFCKNFFEPPCSPFRGKIFSAACFPADRRGRRPEYDFGLWRFAQLGVGGRIYIILRINVTAGVKPRRFFRRGFLAAGRRGTLCSLPIFRGVPLAASARHFGGGRSASPTCRRRSAARIRHGSRSGSTAGRKRPGESTRPDQVNGTRARALPGCQVPRLRL